jgi:SulP family sulfate permease
VLVGVAISILLFVIRQSNRITTRRILIDDEGRLKEVDPPKEVPTDEVVVVQPYGSLFFAATATFEEQLPAVGPESRNSVVILRLRGKEDIGSSLIDVMVRYADALSSASSRFVLVTDSETILLQLERTGAHDQIGPDNLYLGTEWVGETLKKAHRDSLEWVEVHATDEPGDQDSARDR